MPDQPAPPHRFLWRRGRAVQADADSQLLVTFRELTAELGDAERRIDDGLEMGKLPEKLLRTRTWDRSREWLRAAPRAAPLYGDLESAYREIKRIVNIRPGRMLKAYAIEPGDRVEDALTRIRRALDALDASIETLAGGERSSQL